jgi:hypothetical protein
MTERDGAQPDDEGPNWKPRIINRREAVQETTLPNGVKVILRLHFGEYDMVHFERMCRLHPMFRLTSE